MQKLLKFDNFCILQEENASIIVDRSTGIISTADSTVESHNHGNSTVNFLCGFFFCAVAYLWTWKVRWKYAWESTPFLDFVYMGVV